MLASRDWHPEEVLSRVGTMSTPGVSRHLLNTRLTEPQKHDPHQRLQPNCQKYAAHLGAKDLSAAGVHKLAINQQLQQHHDQA